MSHNHILSKKNVKEFGANILEKANGSEARTHLGLVIGTDVQAYSAILNGTEQSFTSALKTKLDGISAGAEVNAVDSVNTQTGAVVLDADDIDDSATTNKFATAAEKTKLSNISVTQAVDLDALEAAVNGLGDAVVLKGSWDASSGSFPSSSDSGFSYIVSVAGTVDSVDFEVGDRLIAITDSASTTTYASNWFKADGTDKVASVNGQTGTVVLTADHIDDSSTTNKFATASQLSKIDGVEAGADVTDATNVAAAGAVMGGDADASGFGFVVDEDNFSSNSNTKLPTQQSVKAYVDNSVSGLASGMILETKTSSFTAEWGKVYHIDSSAGAVTVTLPSASSHGGKIMRFRVLDNSNSITLDPNASETISGDSTRQMYGNGDVLSVESDGTNVFVF